MTTRTSFVAKKVSFPHKNDDEKGSRRQKSEFSAQKQRRERVSSPKNSVSGPKMTTRMSLVAKKVSFPHKNDDENEFRRQKVEVSGTKRRRERVSSPKSGDFRTKTTTRTGVVAKKVSFPHKNDDEKGSRRQKIAFSVSKRRRERVSSPKSEVSGTKRRREGVSSPKKWVLRPKATTRTGLVAKK
ncbi:hypothetical protein P5F77_06545 [Caldifermentibacillus hisashii]|uniref:hypothetical protein n=1 Tax=Caldifermentibacillus hisashii TaxID=996558 RepID=UPI0030D6701C